jgi:predicted dienelactone hydrolase
MQHICGYREGVAYDRSRTAWRTDDPRPLAWAAWYPATVAATPVERLIGVPGAEYFRMGPVAEDAPLNSDKPQWPVVVLSHGTGGMAQGLAWLARGLAKRGFVAIAVSHHGNTTLERYLPEGFLCWWERAADLTTILNILSEDEPFAGRLDLDRTFAAGFSLGGYTVLASAGAITDLNLFAQWLGNDDGPRGPREFPDLSERIPQLAEQSKQYQASVARHGNSYGDPRVRAIFAMAPPPPVRAFVPESVSAIDAPVHIIVGQNDSEAPYDECALWLRAQNPAFEVTLLGTEVGHYVFLPEATDAGKAQLPELCVDPVRVDRRAIHQLAVELASDLFLSVIDEPV